MCKRGQVTIFLILGVLLLILLGGLTMISTKKNTELHVVDSSDYALRNFVQGCFDQALEVGVMTVSAQGWHYQSGDLQRGFQIRSISQDLGDGVDYTRPFSVQEFTNSLERFMQDGFFSCLEGLSEFPDVPSIPPADFIFTYGDNTIFAEMSFPVAQVVDDITQTQENFVSTTPGQVQKVFEAAHPILDAAISGNGIPTDLIVEHANNGVTIKLNFAQGNYAEEVYYGMSIDDGPISVFLVTHNWYD